jgi:hypothetical protein
MMVALIADDNVLEFVVEDTEKPHPLEYLRDQKV